MKIDYPGLVVERLPSGNERYRVRQAGDPSKRVRIHVSPDHADFLEHYSAARAGIMTKAEDRPQAIPNTVSWLIRKYLDAYEILVETGQQSPKTLKKKRGIFKKILKGEWANKRLNIPRQKIVEYQMSMARTPAAADDMVKAVRSMYNWAIDPAKICEVNPAMGIPNIDKGKGGAKPWTVADLQKFKKYHPPGTTPYLVLTILMFTACRIGDAALLGRDNEFTRQGVKGIGWQPTKKNSPFVEIPMIPPLYKATRLSNVIGPTYLLTWFGKPFATSESLGQSFIRWCKEAGLQNRSAHGIRKAAGHLLAVEGCTQYQIMAIHGHAQAQTSEIYTKGVERWGLATDAMKKLEGMEW